MTFGLTAILVFGLAAIAYAAWLPARWRGWALLVASLAAVYWLQPPLAPRYADFGLPTAAIGLATAGWWLTRRPEDPAQQATTSSDRRTLALAAGVVAAMSLFRYLAPAWRLTASRPPPVGYVVLALAAGGGLLFLLGRLGRRRAALALLLALALLFVLLKSPPLAAAAAGLWRNLSGQDVSLAAPADLAWIGYSFLSFRLIHTLRDRQLGLLPALSLREYLTYALFFPAYTAGPIDRAERFVQDYRALPALEGLDAGRWAGGLAWIGLGLLKKFVLADFLAQGLALTPANAAQTEAAGWLWLLLYGYAWRLYFDFAGYSDIAIGLGILYGVRLPENFHFPYLAPNLTSFWQRWHITLSDWARFYVFTPLSRELLRRRPRPPAVLAVFLAQATTMSLIGLWHGITWNFAVWGLWHAVGLFAHKLWSDRTRHWQRQLGRRPGRKRLWTAFGRAATFHYVALGWVWFALPDLGLALDVYAKLLGL
ncbi:MAG: MBOAT family O-acyltransferase [Candidatus Promineifilaceae bacterium]